MSDAEAVCFENYPWQLLVDLIKCSKKKKEEKKRQNISIVGSLSLCFRGSIDSSEKKIAFGGFIDRSLPDIGMIPGQINHI